MPTDDMTDASAERAHQAGDPGHEGPGTDADATGRGPGLDLSDLTTNLGPKQIIGGFALLAALVMLLRRRPRERRRTPDRRRG